MAKSLQNATTGIEVTNITNNRCIQGGSSSHSVINNRRLHSGQSSGDIRSRSSGDIRSIGGTILGPAKLHHHINSSIGVERHISGDNNIEEEIRRVGTGCARAIAGRTLSRRVPGNSDSSTEDARTRGPRPPTFGAISRSSCRAIWLLLPPPPVDNVRVQQWTLAPFEFRTSTAPSQVCT